MMKRYDCGFKVKVVLEALKGQKTMSELSSEYGVHSNQISKWKSQVLADLPKVFSGKREKEDRGAKELISELHQQIGQLKVELDWVKKKAGLAD